MSEFRIWAKATRLLLRRNFTDGKLTGWTIADEKDTTSGPSMWSASTEALAQNGNIGFNANSDALRIFALDITKA